MVESTLAEDMAPVEARRTLDEVFADAEKLDLVPAFAPNRRPLIITQKTSALRPAHWRWSEVKPALDATGELLPPELAERRVLIMRNPAPGNEFATTRTIIAAYQSLLPGEVARTHRHTSHAVRVLLDCDGAYSVTDGERTPMEGGDVLVTPSGEWHAHGHAGDGVAYWVDCLDLPLSYLLEPMYTEVHPLTHQPVTTVTPESSTKFRRGWIARELDGQVADNEGFHGPRIVLPADKLPHIGLAVERLETGRRTRAYRSNANRIFFVMEGQGLSRVEDEQFAWSKGDVFVAPTGNRIEHRSDADAQLLEISDEPLMRFVRYYAFDAAD